MGVSLSAQKATRLLVSQERVQTLLFQIQSKECHLLNQRVHFLQLQLLLGGFPAETPMDSVAAGKQWVTGWRQPGVSHGV